MPKPIAVLTVLVESAGQIVSKEELLERVWNLFKGRLPIVDQQERENTRIMPTAIKRKS
jgi:DNA-binding response OmpR family regulator